MRVLYFRCVEYYCILLKIIEKYWILLNNAVLVPLAVLTVLTLLVPLCSLAGDGEGYAGGAIRLDEQFSFGVRENR